MLVAWPMGRILGGLAEYAVSHAIKDYKQRYPIPTDSEALEQATRALFDEEVAEHAESIQGFADEVLEGVEETPSSGSVAA